MPKQASLGNLRPWRPGQSGNPKGRPKAPRFTERDRNAILAALVGVFDQTTQRAAMKVFRTALTRYPPIPFVSLGWPVLWDCPTSQR
jgi:hypothetical protein